MKKLSSTLLKATIIIIMLTMILGLSKRTYFASITNSLPITSIKTDKKVVAIVCNVYEGTNQVNKMIEVLRKKNLKISFFLGGIWAEKNPECVRKLREMGQDIQNHGYYHKLPSTIDRPRNIREIKETENIIKKIAGVRTFLFEPPSGDYNENTFEVVNSLGYKMVTWSIDTIDWRKDASIELIMSRIRKKLHPGGIILMHPKEVTANNFEEIIEYLQSQGYEIKTVPNLLLEH